MAVQWYIRLLGRLQAVQGEQVVSRFRTRKTGALLAYLGYYSDRFHSRSDLVQRYWPEPEFDLEAGRASLRQALASLRRRLEPPGVTPGSVIVTDRAAVRLNPAAVTTDVAALREALQAPHKPESPAQREQRLIEAVDLYQEPLLPECQENWTQEERGRLNALFFESLAQLLSLLVRTGDLGRAREYARQGMRIDRTRAEALPVLRNILESVEPPSTQVVSNERPKSFGASEDRNKPVPIALPTGTATFLLAEIEAASTLPRAALEDYQSILGSQFRTVPDVRTLLDEAGSLWVMFGRASTALTAAVAGQRTAARYQLPGAVAKPGVRMALHAGEILPGQPPVESADFPHVRRLLAATHGGQILLTETTVSFLRAKPPLDVQLVDLGSYCLPESTQPERLFQANYPAMTPREFPPLKAPRRHVSHLPLQFTRFFGRQAEIERVQELLLSPEGRLVTLTGPGGSGKTRLAVEVAARLAEPLHGAVWFVPLLDLTEPRLIVDAVRDALRLPRLPNVEPLKQVEEALSHHRSLLVLDNFEQLLVDGTQMVQALRESVPELTLLVTSRQRLNLPGEREFSVPCLPTPQGPHTPERLAQCESVQLFVDRAQAARPDFQVTRGNAAAVAGLCLRLEGIPLALELAAAHAQVLTPAQMLANLEQRFKLLVARQPDGDRRHGSLWETLDWSYQLLPPELQRFFARLCVFRGGWTTAAAGAVCEVPDESRAQRYMEQLLGCSLVLSEEDGDAMRFRMLETVREYAAERLIPEEHAEVASCHLRYFLALAEAAERKMPGSEQEFAFAQLEAEYDNLRAVLAWAVANSAAAEGLRLGAALWPFWRGRGHSLEGRRWLAALLDRVGLAAPRGLRARVLHGLGALAGDQGDLDYACSLLQEGLEIQQELGNKRSIGWLLHDQASFVASGGSWKGARALYEESLQIFQELTDKVGIATCLSSLGDLIRPRGELPMARSLFEESLVIRRELGDRLGIAVALDRLGLVAHRRGDLEPARTWFEESLAIRRELGHQWGIATSLSGLGIVRLDQGDAQAARRAFEESLAIFRELGAKTLIAAALNNLGRVAHHQGDLREARSFHQQGLTACEATGNKWGLAMPYCYLGYLAFHEGNLQEADTRCLKSRKLFQELGVTWGLAMSLNTLGLVACFRGDTLEAGLLVRKGLALRHRLGEKRGIAESLESCAAVAGLQGRWERVARLLGTADWLRATIGAPLPPVDRSNHERQLTAARSALGQSAFAEAWVAGQAMPLDQVIAQCISGGRR